MRTLLKYLLFAVAVGIIQFYTVEKAFIAGCSQGVFYSLNLFFGGGLDYSPEVATGTIKMCETMKKQ
jgi:hypothetical protein